MKYFLFTLGCQMNESDSERIASLLNYLGFEPSDEKVADLIVVNACSVRQSAVDRIYGKLKNWEKLAHRPKIIITGCVLPYDKKKLTQKVDLIFDIKDLNKLPQYLSKTYKKEFKNHHSKFIVHNSRKPFALIPIMTGCEHFCTYCAVPYTRGKEISRPEKEIICEVKKAVKNGAKEIILLGQNVNRYKMKSQIQNSKLQINSKLSNSKSQSTPFVKLLKKLVKIPGDFKIKFISANPWNFPDGLTELIAKEPKMSKEIHLPVQSGDNEILKKMNRPYTAKEYLNLVKKMREKIPNLYLSTDIIVGFPGETEKAFKNTLKLCKKAQFNKAYIAQYSPRPGTIAAKFKDDVSPQEKKRRWQILEDLINSKIKARKQKLQPKSQN